MLFRSINFVDDGFAVRRGDVLVQDGKIASAGRKIESYDGPVYDGAGKLLIPGLVNSHCHVPMTLLRGYGDGLPLQEWLFGRVFPFEDTMRDEDAYFGAMLGIAEMLACGVTSFTELYMFPDSICRAVTESGIKCSYSRSIVEPGEGPLRDSARFREAAAAHDRYDGANGGRLRVRFDLHAEYTSSESTIRQLADFARERRTPLRVHLSETAREHEECRQRHGRTPARFLDECGFFAVPGALAAHCVHLEDGDFAVLREREAGVAHCPSSNLKLGSGIADIPRMREEGIRIGIGTDGASSNNNLNMMEELHIAAILHGSVPAAEILRMATRNGALLQGRTDSGLIREGFCADLAVVDFNRPHLQPVHDMLSSLVYSAQGSDVVLTMADGEILYRDGQFARIEPSYIQKKCAQSVAGILTRLGSE